MQTELDERNPASSPSLSQTFAQHTFTIFTLPLQISSSVCSAASLLLVLTSLCTSYWVTESSPQGLVHSGLWAICIDSECTLYGFDAVATFIHVTRSLLVATAFLGIMSLSCICLSIQRTHLGPVPVITAAAVLSFGAGLFTLISMSVFTASYRSSKPYIQELVTYGSSYSLGWTSALMYAMTGCLILLTKRTMES